MAMKTMPTGWVFVRIKFIHTYKIFRIQYWVHNKCLMNVNYYFLKLVNHPMVNVRWSKVIHREIFILKFNVYQLECPWL